MNLTATTSIDQLIPISRARANLPSLIEKLAKKDFFLLAKKYQPQAALVNIKFLDKLMTAYKKWQRAKDFTELEEIYHSIPQYPPEEVEADIKYALKQVRKTL